MKIDVLGRLDRVVLGSVAILVNSVVRPEWSVLVSNDFFHDVEVLLLFN